MSDIGVYGKLGKVLFFLLLLVIGFSNIFPAFAACPSKDPNCNGYYDVNDTYCDGSNYKTVCTCKRYWTSTGYYYYWSTSSCGTNDYCQSGSCVDLPSCSSDTYYARECVRSTWSNCDSVKTAPTVCSDNSDGTTKCCVNNKTCSYKWPGSVCYGNDGVCILYGGSALGTAYGCNFLEDTCCMEGAGDEVLCKIDEDCQFVDSCRRCINPDTINSDCVSTWTTGAAGVCGDSAGDSFCSYPSNGKCSTTYGVTALDTVGNDGKFNWKCLGQPAGTCRTAGVGTTCAATKLATVNGVCGSSDGGNGTSKPTTGLCSDTTGMVWVDQVATDYIYDWNCGQCDDSPASCTYTRDVAPVLDTTVLKNESGTTILATTAPVPPYRKQNHICDPAFAGSKTSVWEITATDGNGVSDIGEISLRLDSTGDDYDFGPVSAVNGVATFNVGITDPGTYLVRVLIKDKHDLFTTDWVSTGRYFKIWDCQVTVDGTIYDNSTNLPCSNSNENGFTTTIAADIEKFDFGYGALTAGDTKRNMTVVSPGFYSPDKLTWQNNYFLDTLDTSGLPFLGQFRTSKINDVCVAWNINPLSPRNYVSAYDANPTLNIKYSAVMDQEAWFRVNKGSILAETSVKNLVAITCSDNCKTTSQGLVWSKNINLATSDSSRQATNQPQPPKRNYYYTLKYDIYGGKEIGTTYPDDEFDLDLWSRKIGTSNPSGVMFIEGDLIIDQDISASNYAFIIVSGSIIINDNVKTILGTMMYAENEIVASGQSNNQLVITGSLYGKKAVILNRSYTTKRDNNLSPAVEVIYDPNFAFRLPKELWVVLKNWRLE